MRCVCLAWIPALRSRGNMTSRTTCLRLKPGVNDINGFIVWLLIRSRPRVSVQASAARSASPSTSASK